MPIRSHCWVLAWAGLAGAAAPELAVGWYSVPVPGIANLDRADMGLAGEAEPGGPLMDALVGGSRNNTAVGLSYQQDRGNFGGSAWSRNLVGFDLGAVVEGTEGLEFGVQALDLQPKPSAQAGDVGWTLDAPEGGLRLGIGAEALRLVRDQRDWSLGFGFWIPVYSSEMAWELQTALVRTRTFRLDLSAAWSQPSIPSSLSHTIGDSTVSDSIWWRTSQKRVSARVGLSPLAGLAVQAWGGWRREEAPGAQTNSVWSLSGASWFGGAQGDWAVRGWNADGEMRWDEGHETALLDTATGLGWMDPSGRSAGNADHNMANGTFELRAPPILLGAPSDVHPLSLQPLAAVQDAWLRLDGEETGSSVQPWDPGGTWGEEHRWEAEAGLRWNFPWFSLEPRIGIQRLELAGDPPRLWWGFPVGHGVSWDLPWQAKILHEGRTGTGIAYKISGEIHVSGTSALSPGLRNEASLSQEF
jgi:hypothetical protein